MKINVTSEGNFSNFENYVNSMVREDFSNVLKPEAQSGLNEFIRKTPKRSGKTASQWHVELEKSTRGSHITYYNSNVTKNGVPLPILIDGGHGTGTGGYVAPKPFIQNVVDTVGNNISKSVERRMKPNGQ